MMRMLAAAKMSSSVMAWALISAISGGVAGTLNGFFALSESAPH
jgi:hypothetical protein